jgi:hypothetical protein
MSEIFKERVVESPVEPEIAPSGLGELKSDELAGNEKKVTEPLDNEQKTLDIWEGEHKRKFVTEYFKIGNIDGEFNLRMDTSVIDKFIKQQLEERRYEKNIDNWQEILAGIENDIGSSRMEVFSRIKKIVGYIKAVNRLNDAKQKRELYLNRDLE